MEITKTEKFDLSQIAVRSTGRSTLTTRVAALEVGEGFIVDNVSRDMLTSKAQALRGEGRRFAINKLNLTRFRIVRVA